jgi:cytochrome b
MAVEEQSRWDPVVKLTHWSIVAAVLANAVFTEEGSAAHVWVGYGLAAILGLRLLWGVIGPVEARFTAFMPSIKRASTHLRDIRHGIKGEHKSHNPLGALMVYAIWACLLTIIATGISMAGLPDTFEGQKDPVAVASTQGESGEREGRDAREEHEEGLVSEVHGVAANLLYLLTLLHLAGVLFETRRSGSKVILAMVPGHR